MAATATKTGRIEETYDRGHGDSRRLAYLIDKHGDHVVAIYFPFTDQDYPNIRRHATVEAARQTWREIRDQLIFQGYAKSTRPR